MKRITAYANVITAIVQIVQVAMICTATDGSDASDRAQFDDIHPAYDTLTPHQKEVYNDLLGPISRAEWRIGCAVLDEYDNVGFLFDILNAIESDHPEYWWQDYYYCTVVGNRPGLIRPDRSPSTEDCMRGYQELMGIVRGITFTGSDGDRVRDAHNWLCAHARYDTLSDECGNQYGAIVCGLAKCDGYTYAMNLLCKQAGVESLYTEGLLLPEKSFHAWNINKVDGKWYYTDVTWDDQIGLDPIHNYRYLLLGSDKLSNRQPNYTYGLDISESRSPYRPYTNTETAVFITVLVLIVLLLVWFFVSRHIRNRKFVRMYLEKKERQQQTRTDGT